ncbi:MAG: ABC transporter permease [Streptosporangiales bacterium]
MNQAVFIVRRLLHMVIVVLGVTIVVFFMIHMVPGDPARIYLGTRATPSAIANLHEQWGLNQPLPQQYVSFMADLLHGDLGESLLYHSSASEVVVARLPVTVWLVIYAVILTIVITIPFATVSALRKDHWEDHATRVGSLAALGMPSFWVGIVLLLVLGVQVKAFPVGGFGEGVLGHVYHLFLPAVTLAISLSPLLIRSLRASMIDVLSSDYVVTAMAKGVSSRRIVARHLLPNAAIPTLTLLGVNVGFLVGGTVVIERVYGLSGVGNLMVDAILARDFTVVQGVTLVFAVGVVLVNFLTDLLYMVLDPRVRIER